MDTELLVEKRIEDGQNLIERLNRDGFPVTVAFWVKTRLSLLPSGLASGMVLDPNLPASLEEAQWFLYIASPSVHPESPGAAYGTVYAALSRVPDPCFSLSEIKLVNSTNPAVRDALVVRERYPGRILEVNSGKRFGDLSIDKMYVYPVSMVTAPVPDIVERFSAFIAAERQHYEDNDNNRVAFSLSQVGRYLRFVEIIKRRYRAAEDAFAAHVRQTVDFDTYSGSPRELTAEEMDQLKRSEQLQDVLHLEFESFMLFAKVLLDKIAQFVEDFFGRARDVSLKSHDRWCKAAQQYSAAKQLEPPEGMVNTMLQLRTVVADYRDKQIAHFNNPRAVRGTAIGGKNSAQIITAAIYPRDKDKQTNSPTVDEVTILIEAYIGQFLSLIESNRTKSRYKLRLKTG